MGATYLGDMTVGETIPGATAALDALGDAVRNLRTAIATAGTAIASAKIAIRVPSVADFQAAVDASVSIGADLAVADPVTYIAGMIQAVSSVSANIAALTPPSIALTGQIDANLALGVAAEAKIAAVDAELDALTDVTADLDAAAAAALGALDGWLGLQRQHAAAGARAFVYDGPASAFGTDSGAALVAPETGIVGGTTVRAVLVAVEATDALSVDAVNATFRVA